MVVSGTLNKYLKLVYGYGYVLETQECVINHFGWHT